MSLDPPNGFYSAQKWGKMTDMEKDFEAQAMLEDLRTGYGDRTPAAAPTPATENPRMRDWKRRTSVQPQD